ncbi:PKD domain-containing protein [Flavobacterium sp. EDS]|uniref:PKD domain-containing protein n=1 Tax=Flavobacterium sp. EDS TaxID=2897328 RepID=UPI001E44A9C0|nr:PKD domain-containing protein [Flavobacterium sp. EDS]MCD0474487.1 PKD domain-containing protein [Flavobacterium sp. EDS]
MKKIYFFVFILLNVLNSCSSDTSEETKLVAAFNLSSTIVNIGDEIKVTNSSTSDKEIVSYVFSFGNDKTSTEKEPTFYYSQAGDYDVKLVIKDINGNIAYNTLRVKVTEENSFLLENQTTVDSDVTSLEIGIHDNKIFYTEAYRPILTSGSRFYRNVQYDDVTKTFTTKVVAEKIVNSGNTQTTFLNNGNRIVTMVESINYLGGREAELNSDWSPVRLVSGQTTYGSIPNNDQFYFYGAYNHNPSIEIRNSAGQLVSRKTYENVLKNAFIGDLIKTGNTYVGFGGKYENSTTADAFQNYKPILLFFNENLELISQKTFENSSLHYLLKSWNDLNGSFNLVKLSNGNLAIYSHDELRITTALGEEVKLIKFNNSTNLQSLIEVEDGVIVSSTRKLEKYNNSGNLTKSISYIGSFNTGFVKKGDLIYFATTYSTSYQNYSLYKIKLGAIDSNLVFKKI